MKILLFDIDGTLVHTRGTGKRALAEAIDARLQVQGAGERLRLSGRTDPSILREIFASYDLPFDDARAQDILDDYLDRFAAEIAQAGDLSSWELPGARRLLASLEGVAALAVATGNVERGARLKLEAVGLDHFFPVGGFGSDHEERPALVRIGAERAASHYRIDPAGVVVIGDTPLDIEAARRNGYHAVGVATGVFSRDDLVESGADAVLDSLDDPSARALLLGLG